MLRAFREPIERSKYGFADRLRVGRAASMAAGVELIAVVGSVAAENATPAALTAVYLAAFAGSTAHDLHGNRNHGRENFGRFTRWLIKPDDQVLAVRQQRQEQQPEG